MSNSKQIINKIKHYRSEELINFAVSKIQLYDFSNNIQQHYWSYLTLIKWSLEFGSNLSRRKKPTESECNKLAEIIFNSMDQHDFADFKVHKFKVFRVLAYQQFRFQRKDFLNPIVSAYILFTENEFRHKHTFEDIFEKTTRISLTDFYTSLFLLYNYLKKSRDYNFGGNFQFLLSAIIGKSASIEFINLLSLDTRNSKYFIEMANKRIRNYNAQVFDNEVFFEYPILKFGNKLRYLNNSILCNTAELLPYIILKRVDPKFASEFGFRLEKYVIKCIEETSLNFITETQLKQKFAGSKLVDLLVEDNILIECKSIEVKPNISVYPSSTKLSNDIKKSISKAFTQQIPTIVNKLNTEKECFGIVITYRDLMLGNMVELWNDFLRDARKNYCEENNLKINKIPECNCFIMSINDWENICGIVKKGNISIQEILVNSRGVYSDPLTQKFSFSQNLQKYLKNETETLEIKEKYYSNLLETMKIKK